MDLQPGSALLLWQRDPKSTNASLGFWRTPGKSTHVFVRGSSQGSEQQATVPWSARKLGAAWLQMVGVGHIRRLVRIMKTLLWKHILSTVKWSLSSFWRWDFQCASKIASFSLGQPYWFHLSNPWFLVPFAASASDYSESFFSPRGEGKISFPPYTV